MSVTSAQRKKSYNPPQGKKVTRAYVASSNHLIGGCGGCHRSRLDNCTPSQAHATDRCQYNYNRRAWADYGHLANIGRENVYCLFRLLHVLRVWSGGWSMGTRLSGPRLLVGHDVGHCILSVVTGIDCGRRVSTKSRAEYQDEFG